MKNTRLLLILIVTGLIFNFNSCNGDDFTYEELTTENPEDPEDPEDPGDPGEGEYAFKRTIQNVTQNPCGGIYCSIKQLIFLNNEIGYSISGVDIYKTINGGETWGKIFNQDIIGRLNLLSEDLMFINVYDGIAKTTNGFSSVSLIERPMEKFCPETGFLNEGVVQFVDEQNGFIRDDCYKGILHHTSDSGENWDQIYNSENDIDEYYFQNANEGFVKTNNQLYLTVNAGQTWEEVSYLPNHFKYLLFMNDKFLFPGGETVDKPEIVENGITIKYYDFNNNGDIAVVLYDEGAVENKWKLMLYVNTEESEWIFVDQLPDVEYNYSSLYLLDNKTMYVSKTHSGDILQYKLE